jgi:hypothetical protein
VLGGSITVLHRVEGAEHGAQVPVASPFQFVDRMMIETALPKPFAMKTPRVGKVGHFQLNAHSTSGNDCGVSAIFQRHMLLIPRCSVSAIS